MRNFRFTDFFLGFCLFFCWSLSSLAKENKLSIISHWVADTIESSALSPRLMNNSSPLVLDSLVVQGNAVNGLKAYHKETGKKVWSFHVPSGVAASMLFYKKNIYFGGADGFFYSVQAATGQLNWKFWTGSENSGPPLIYKGKLYWTAQNQKLYALNLNGKLLWIYSGPSLYGEFVVKGRPRPAIYKNLIYMGFYDGSLVAINRQTGKLKWKRTLSSSQAIREGLELTRACLIVPVFNSHLFCLKFLNGEIRWKLKGASSVLLSKKSVLYHSDKKRLYATSHQKRIWSKKIKEKKWPLSPSVFENYLIYGFVSLGKLVFVNSKNGKTLRTYNFGKGLAAPVSVDSKDKAIYFMSVDGYLRKISIL